MTLELVRQQVLAMRAQCDAILIALGGDVCDHKEKDDFSTFGREHWRCRICGFEKDSQDGEAVASIDGL